MLEYKKISRVLIYNLSSYFSDVPTLSMLIPNIQYIPESALDGDISVVPEFDIMYGQHVIQNNEAFLQLMMLLVPEYTEPDTLIQVLIDRSEFRDAITESLVKLVQQRYGYNICIVNEIDDFIYAEESDFSIPGLFALDADLERWRMMMASMGQRLARYKKVTTCPRVQTASGENVVADVPLVTPLEAAQ